uniref:hypothetical protein n=1 Tax=Pleomorphomonas oryzae TaxID=261934 RepID=UPI0006853532
MLDKLMAGVRVWPAGAVFAPEDGGGSGGGDGSATAGAGAPAGGQPSAEAGKPAADGAAGSLLTDTAKPDAAKPTEGQPEAWKPYVNDPAKSADDNAKAKAEHDLKDPANPINRVPDDGKYEFTMPEGIELDAKLTEAMSPIMKDIGLTQGQAQKLANQLAEHMKTGAAAEAADWTKLNTSWVETAKKDPEIGGEKWNASVETAQRALAQFGTPELNAFLVTSGGGNHPEVIRFMARIGAAVADDQPGNGGNGDGGGMEAAHLLFPNDKPKG